MFIHNFTLTPALSRNDGQYPCEYLWAGEGVYFQSSKELTRVIQTISNISVNRSHTIVREQACRKITAI